MGLSIKNRELRLKGDMEIVGLTEIFSQIDTMLTNLERRLQAVELFHKEIVEPSRGKLTESISQNNEVESAEKARKKKLVRMVLRPDLAEQAMQ